MGSVKWTSGGQAFLGAVATLLLGHAKGPGWWRTTQRTFGQARATADRQTTSQSVTSPGPNPTNRTASTARTLPANDGRSTGPSDRNQHPVSTGWQEADQPALPTGTSTRSPQAGRKDGLDARPCCCCVFAVRGGLALKSRRTHLSVCRRNSMAVSGPARSVVI